MSTVEPQFKPQAEFSTSTGIGLLALMIVAAMFGVSYLGSGRTPLDSPVFLGCEVLALAALAAFVRHSRRHAAPFVSYRLLRGRGFGVMNLINFVYGAAALGFAALVPLYAQDGYRVAALGAGTLLTARAIGMIAIAGVAAMALRRTGYRLPMIAGFAILAGGLVMMAFAPAGLSPYAWLAIAAAITGCGMGVSVPASNNASLQLAPDQVAAIAGLRGMFRQSGRSPRCRSPPPSSLAAASPVWSRRGSSSPSPSCSSRSSR